MNKDRLQFQGKYSKTIAIISSSILIIYFIIVLIFFAVPIVKQQLSTTDAMASQLTSVTDSYLDNIRNQTAAIINSEDFKNSLDAFVTDPSNYQKKSHLVLCLHDSSNEYTKIQAIALEFENGSIINSVVGMSDAYNQVLSSQWYSEVRSLKNVNRFYKIIERNNGYGCAYSKNFENKSGSFIITVFFDATELVRSEDLIADNIIDDYVFLDSAQSPFLYKTAMLIDTGIFNDIDTKSLINGTRINKIGYIKASKSAESTWIICAFTSQETLIGMVKSKMMSAVPLFFVVLIVVLLFIRMAIKFEEQSLQLINNERNETAMRHALMISQIDPHFIYNTIHTTSMLARQKRTDEIIVINSALVGIMRNQLRIGEFNLLDIVAQEVDITKKYLIIQGYKYESEINVLWDIEADLLAEKIPKFIIQPLVENALFHGLLRENGDVEGDISVSVKKHDDEIIICVHDTGKGIDPQKIKSIGLFDPSTDGSDRGNHVGLYNIRKRLQYLYSRDDLLNISSELGEWTNVEIIIPRKKQKEN